MIDAPDLVEFFFKRDLVERGEREAEEQTDSAVERKEGVAECFLDLLWGAVHGGGIGNAPVSGHRLTRPNGANLFGGVVANGKNEIELGRAWFRELVPAFALKAVRRDMGGFELIQCLPTHCSGRVTARAKGGEIRPALLIHDCLRHDGAGRVSRT